MGHMTFGRSKMAHGELAAARSHLEQALELFRSSLDDPTVIWAFHSAISRRVVLGNTHGDLASISCWTGFPEQALLHIAAMEEQVEDEARASYTRLHLWFHLRVLAFLSEPLELVVLAEKIAGVNSEYGIPQFGALATIMRGCAIARCGDPETGRAIIGDGLAAYTATGAAHWSCYFRAQLAETYQMTGETDEALHMLLEALEDTERTGELWYVAELHRHIGEAHRQRGAELV
jgi:tetratricopeptide (TPR) repeat protein